MKMKRLSILLASCICSATLLTGCSFSEVTSTVSGFASRLFGKTQEVTESAEKEKKIEKSGMTVDSSVEKPEFTGSISGKTQMAMGSVYGFACPATVSNGKLSYQWYSNNVNSNGGGTPIKGATDEIIAVDTSEPSHRFYYCVVTNEVNGKVNRNTSDVHEFIIWDIGTWQADETGAVRYMMIDGTYPKDTWFYADENFYYVDVNGYRATGLKNLGEDVYYFNDEGQLQRDTTGPNGETVDGAGRVVSAAPAAEGEAPAEAPAEEAPAEAPAEEAPAQE